MKKLKLIEIAFVVLITGKSLYASEVKRLVSTNLDLSKPYKVYLSYDLVSSIKFPYPITEAKIGNPESVKVLISKTLGSELSLKLQSRSLSPTNLIVRCAKRVFVIDIIPSKSIHQDYVKITGGYSDPEYEGSDLKLVTTSKYKGVLIDSSKRYIQ